MANLPEEIHFTDDRSLISVCTRVCTELKPSGNRERDEETIFAILCRVFAKRSQKNVFFASSPGSTKIDNLREHLLLLINDHKKSDEVFECIYEFLDNVYPQEEELWRLKM